MRFHRNSWGITNQWYPLAICYIWKITVSGRSSTKWTVLDSYVKSPEDMDGIMFIYETSMYGIFTWLGIAFLEYVLIGICPEYSWDMAHKFNINLSKLHSYLDEMQSYRAIFKWCLWGLRHEQSWFLSFKIARKNLDTWHSTAGMWYIIEVYRWWIANGSHRYSVWT